MTFLPPYRVLAVAATAPKIYGVEIAITLTKLVQVHEILEAYFELDLQHLRVGLQFSPGGAGLYLFSPCCSAPIAASGICRDCGGKQDEQHRSKWYSFFDFDNPISLASPLDFWEKALTDFTNVDILTAQVQASSVMHALTDLAQAEPKDWRTTLRDRRYAHDRIEACLRSWAGGTVYDSNGLCRQPEPSHRAEPFHRAEP